jgi:hypothetical protein
MEHLSSAIDPAAGPLVAAPVPEPESDAKTPKARPGRPARLNPELREEYLNYLRLGCTRGMAAELAGVGRHTVARVLRDEPDFAQHVRAAQADGASAAMRQINQAAPTHWRAAAWVLDQRRKPRSRVTTRQLLRSREFSEAVRRMIDEHSPRNQAVELIRAFLKERAKDALAAGPNVDVFDIERFPLLTLDFSHGA